MDGSERATLGSRPLADDDCLAFDFVQTSPFLFPLGIGWNRCRGNIEARRLLPAGDESISCARSCRTERRRMQRPVLESNAVGKGFHHIELNTTSELRAGGAPYLRNAPWVIMESFYLKRNFRLKTSF